MINSCKNELEILQISQIEKPNLTCLTNLKQLEITKIMVRYSRQIIKQLIDFKQNLPKNTILDNLKVEVNVYDNATNEFGFNELFDLFFLRIKEMQQIAR